MVALSTELPGRSLLRALFYQPFNCFQKFACSAILKLLRNSQILLGRINLNAMNFTYITLGHEDALMA